MGAKRLHWVRETQVTKPLRAIDPNSSLSETIWKITLPVRKQFEQSSLECEPHHINSVALWKSIITSEHVCRPESSPKNGQNLVRVRCILLHFPCPQRLPHIHRSTKVGFTQKINTNSCCSVHAPVIKAATIVDSVFRKSDVDCLGLTATKLVQPKVASQKRRFV